MDGDVSSLTPVPLSRKPFPSALSIMHLHHHKIALYFLSSTHPKYLDFIGLFRVCRPLLERKLYQDRALIFLLSYCIPIT